MSEEKKKLTAKKAYIVIIFVGGIAGVFGSLFAIYYRFPVTEAERIFTLFFLFSSTMLVFASVIGFGLIVLRKRFNGMRIMKAESRESLLRFKEHYERCGCKVKLCDKCGKIKEIVWSEVSFDGPSISSGMTCLCKKKTWGVVKWIKLKLLN